MRFLIDVQPEADGWRVTPPALPGLTPWSIHAYVDDRLTKWPTVGADREGAPPNVQGEEAANSS